MSDSGSNSSGEGPQQQQGQQPLLTPTALKQSLAPPRAPPFGTVHHAVYTGKNPDRHPWVHHYHVRETKTTTSNHHPSDTHHPPSSHFLRRKLLERMRHHHPHLAERSADAATRLLGRVWSVDHQNRFRDSGQFRSVADGLVTASVPILALTHPKQISRFRELSKICTSIQYGDQVMQYIDYMAPTSGGRPRRLIFFVHGGAWGSGMPWMYRMVAHYFLLQEYAVAIVGYRTYPDGKIEQQIHDLDQALQALEVQRPVLQSCPMTVMGHSSGAHVALLWIIRDGISQTTSSAAKQKDSETLSYMPLIDSYVGLSGPYDISHHFDYEAGRGVEELSPMKPVNGHTRRSFHHNSPCRHLQRALASFTHRSESTVKLPKNIVLMHGIDDETVPFTATGEAARLLRSCGVPTQEEYILETGHQDLILQVMLGGRTQVAVMDWIRNLSLKERSSMAPLMMKSKL